MKPFTIDQMPTCEHTECSMTGCEKLLNALNKMREVMDQIDSKRIGKHCECNAYRPFVSISTTRGKRLICNGCGKLPPKGEVIGSSSGPDVDTKGGECPKCGTWKGGDYGMNGAGEQTRHTCPEEPTTSEGEIMCKWHGQVCTCETHQKDWEARFDEKFCRDYIPGGEMKYIELRGSEVEALKAFIREEKKKSSDEGFVAREEAYQKGRNEVIEEVLPTLKYIASRNKLHNSVCIDSAQALLDRLT